MHSAIIDSRRLLMSVTSRPSDEDKFISPPPSFVYPPPLRVVLQICSPFIIRHFCPPPRHCHCQRRSVFHFRFRTYHRPASPPPRPPPPPRPAVSRFVFPRPAPSCDQVAFEDDGRCHRQEKAAVQASKRQQKKKRVAPSRATAATERGNRVLRATCWRPLRQGERRLVRIY